MPISGAAAAAAERAPAVADINPQLVEDCRASKPAFGQPRAPQNEELAPPAGPPGLAYPSRNAPPGYPGATAPSQNAPSPSAPDQPGAVPGLPPEEQPEAGPAKLPAQFRRTTINYASKEPPGTIIIDTPHTYLYLVLGNGKAMRYGIGVGREGFTWAGTEHVSRMAEWPDWNPPPEMIERQPLPAALHGGRRKQSARRPRALSRADALSDPRHQPAVDHGTFVSSGCIRLTNEDVSDPMVGSMWHRVVVLPARRRRQRRRTSTAVESDATSRRPAADPAEATGPRALDWRALF